MSVPADVDGSATGLVAGLPSRLSSARRKLTFNEQRELEALPERIAALEAEQKRLEAASVDPDFYKTGSAAIGQTLTRLEEVDRELLAAYARWDQLDSRST